MSDAREEGEWIYYNPLAHVQMLLTSILMAPTMLVVDAIVDEDISTSQSRNLTTPNTAQEQFGYALEAIKREDWEAGYRLLEDFVISDDEMLRLRTLQLFNDNHELLDAAPDTFSKLSLEESRHTYGTSAKIIERERLDLYKQVAQPEAYSRALENFNLIFQTQWERYKLKKSGGELDFKLLCKAAEEGEYRAQWELGYIHLYGLYGVRKDLVLSVMWYDLVEAGGHDPKGVDHIREQLTTEQLIEVEHLHENWKSGQCEREIFGAQKNNLH
jgi:hypothetical protein